MKRRMLAVLLTVVMATSLAACGKQDAVTNDPEKPVENEQDNETDKEQGEEQPPAEEATKPTEPTGQIIIGSTTDLTNEFYDVSFDNGAFNYKMYDLIHGGDTVTYTKEGEFVVNETIVEKIDAVENEDGTKTYTVTLKDGQVWSDNTPVTAKDYVFAILLESSDEMTGVDAYPCIGFTSYVGYNEYVAGETDVHKGVHLIDDKTFSVTVVAEELPFHWDLTYAAVRPRPLAVIAPGCDIEDTEEGAKITGDFTTELLLETINNPDTGYRYNPQVVNGPYLFKGYDESSRTGTLEVNPTFIGDYAGRKPLIKTVILKTVKDQTQMNELEAGSVDVLFSISGGDSINAGLDLVDAGTANKTTFFRNGYGMISFDCSVFPTDSASVRQAVALCLNRNEFAKQYSGGYATVVHGSYGLAQKEYADSKDWIEDNLDTYEMDIERAKQLLAEDGWTLNAEGGEYTEGIRYKEVDGELKPLQISWCNTADNPVADLLRTMLPENMAAAGMELVIPSPVDFPTLQANQDHQTDERYNMYNLATGFASAYSPWYYYSMDEQWMGSGYNSNWIKDQELADVTAKMKPIPYENYDEWLAAWQEFQLLWNQKMPNIPLYSDQYHTFTSLKVQDWDQTAIWDWNGAVLDAWVSE